MGFLGSGWTTAASSQNPSGRSAKSGGEVLSISRSVTRRRRSRSARPRAGRSLFFEGLEVRLALTSITHAGRDDATNDGGAGLDPIRVDHGERKSLGEPDGDNSQLPVIPAHVVALQRGAVKDERGELEVEPTFPEVSGALSRVPREAHSRSIRVYIRSRNLALGAWSGLTVMALSCEPQRLCGSLEAPTFRCQTLPEVGWNALWLVSCSALLGGGPRCSLARADGVAMSRWLGQPIAERELERSGERRARAGFRIGRPRRAREGDYECRYELYGFGRSRRMRIFGVDEVQALQLALVAVRAELQRMDNEAIWLEEPAYRGLPLTVPTYLPAKYVKRVEAALARANSAFAKEVRSSKA